jgi:hypothetical protein
MIVWRSLTALAVLIFSVSFGLGVSIIASSDAQAGSRHGGHGGYGGRGFGGHSMHAGHMQAVRMMPVRAIRSHPAIAYTARPYTAASYAPRVHRGYAGHGGARVVQYAAPVRQVRYVQYQPTAYHQATYSTMSRHAGAHQPRRHCTC